MEQKNAKCRDLANDAYTNIDWGRFFYTKSRQKLDLILSIPLILFSSIFLFFVCDGAIAYITFMSSPNLLQILNNNYAATGGFYLFFSISVRSIATYLIIREILKRFEAFDAEYSGINTGISTYSTISNLDKLKLFVYSLIIMSMPIMVFVVMVGYGSPGFVRYTQYNIYGSAMLFILDIARLAILMYVVIPKIITNRHKIDTTLTIMGD